MGRGMQVRLLSHLLGAETLHMHCKPNSILRAPMEAAACVRMCIVPAAVPKFWGLLMGKLIGTKAADKLLLTGKLVSPAEVRKFRCIPSTSRRAHPCAFYFCPSACGLLLSTCC